MNKGKALRLGGFITAIGATAAFIAGATSATGAYFNDTSNGTITGTVGSIRVHTWGGGGQNGDHGGLDFNFANLLPGTPQTAHAGFANSGANPEDVYLVFPNAPALHAVNNMGRYGQVSVASNFFGPIFDSTNLNDGFAADGVTAQGAGHCPTNPTAPAAGNETEANAINGTSDCWPLPNVLKIAGNLQPGQSGDLYFSFGLGAKWKWAITEGTTALCYPMIQNSADPSNLADQVCTGASSGLPYEIVATQVGIAPNDPLNTTPTP